MHPLSPIYCIIFHHQRRIAAGELAEAARLAHSQLGPQAVAETQVFDAQSSRPIDIDWRGSADDVAARLQPAAATESGPAARGRPRLGVVSREVTLLPRHWEWLGEQPGGASVTLRKLIDQARQADEAQGQGARRRAQESAHRFMTAMAGDAPGFEEALRALFAGDRQRFEQFTGEWPPDVREHSRQLAAVAFAA
ncbi:DUF2239 family protein [Tahibacter harae]|uniref:DUF2239 family protein n=1 Tax=Tahibacter harae TaxID=2963937 RepID=A0ABT1QWX4_9GAMM|nr:DUF2239 family protein [Tahibacter harae]MCQ4166797.1 DUF2239 family protein [Tahibacter harae]